MEEGNEQTQTKSQETNNHDQEKALVQQLLHPAFLTRPRSSSLSKVSSRRLEQGKNPQNETTDSEIDPMRHSVKNMPPPWQRVPTIRGTKRKKVSSPSPDKIDVSNRFRGLPADEKEDDVDLPKKIPKPPPIILYGIEDVSKLTEVLEGVVSKNDFTYKVVNQNQLRIACFNVETYKHVIDTVRGKGLIGHTFNRKDKRPYRIVIRNLHHTTPISIIKETLEGTGNTVVGEIINAKYGPEKKPTSTFFVNLAQGPNNKVVKNVRYIYHQSIIIEDPRKRKAIAQCQRCQQYGHTKNYCMRPYRCVKCAQPHKTADCPKRDRNTPAKCALCLGDHPANYKGCEVYKEILARKTNKPTYTKQKVNSEIVANPTTEILPQINLERTRPTEVTDINKRQRYNDTLRGINNNNNEDKPTSTRTIEEMFLKQTEKMDLILQQMSTLISLITTLVSN